MPTQLDKSRAAELQRASFSYAEVGATASDSLPPGYRHLTRSRSLPGRGFTECVEALMTWRVHEAAGLRVEASSMRAEKDAVLLMRLGIEVASLKVPCRVVYVLDEPSRAGFAYGTLPGHPESGEELFAVERDDAGRARIVVRAFSRPATRLARLSGPANHWAQSLIANRYLAALDT